MSEIEHKHDPIIFLKKIKKVLKNKGNLVLRIPNFYNIYMTLLGKSFLKFDYRTSHNFYFSKKNLDLIFNKIGFKIVSSYGINEYSFNHLLSYVKRNKRVTKKEVFNYFPKTIDKRIINNINDSFSSTSLVYILTV